MSCFLLCLSYLAAPAGYLAQEDARRQIRVVLFLQNLAFFLQIAVLLPKVRVVETQGLCAAGWAARLAGVAYHLHLPLVVTVTEHAPAGMLKVVYSLRREGPLIEAHLLAEGARAASAVHRVVDLGGGLFLIVHMHGIVQ